MRMEHPHGRPHREAFTIYCFGMERRMSDNGKCLVLFQGGVETQEFFSFEMAKEFDRLGYIIFFYNLLDEEESFKELKSFVRDAKNSGRSVYMFSFNFNGLAGERYLYGEDGVIYWDEEDIPCFNMVLDHPFYYHRYLERLPQKYYQISIDYNHERYMKRFFPDIALAGFLPLAGTILDTGEDIIPIGDRNIDIAMTGNYTRPETFERYISHLDKEYIDFYHAILDRQLANPGMTLEEVAEPMLAEALRGDGSALDGSLTDDDIKACYGNMIFIDLWARFYYRGRVVASLAEAGIRVDTFGAGWDALECGKPDNVICHGSRSSRQCLEALAQSRAALNVMPWFKDGAHDRIFNGMLNGAAVITDESRYLRRILTDWKNVCFYSISDMGGLVECVEKLFKDRTLLAQIAGEGRRFAARNHTWADRADRIDEMLT